jgi:thioredoxin-related protein
MRSLRYALPLLLAIAAGTAAEAANDLPAARDLRVEAERSTQAGHPLVIIFSRADCRYCETVKRDYLKPLAADPRYAKLVIRQVNQDSDAPLSDFRGEKTSHARFASAQKVKLVPVVAFYDAQGRQLAEPIVGARLPDFYQSYLETALAKAGAALPGQ